MTKITIYQESINNKIYGLSYKTAEKLLKELDSFFPSFHWEIDEFQNHGQIAYGLECEVKTAYKHECINNIKEFLEKGLEGKLYKNVHNNNTSIYLY